MNTKNKIMITLCVLNWVFCILGIILRPFSIVAWWITFGLQLVCLVATIIVAILNVIELKREERRLLKQLAENRKHFEELVRLYWEQKAKQCESDKIENN